jgi:hypothetical protein
MRRGAINKRGIFPRLTGYICVLLTVFVWGCNLGDSSTPEVTYGTPVDPEILFPPEDSRTPPKDSRMDSLAKCLTAKGAVVYGSSRCSRTKRQIEAFGEAFNHIVYVNCIASEEACDAKGIRSYPTWIIKGRKFPSFLSPTVLADLAGCD